MKNSRFLSLVFAPLLNIVLFCVACVVLQPQVALAHSYVIGSDPVDGSTVTTQPKVVHIYFNANISHMSAAQVAYVQNGSYVAVATQSAVSQNNPRELDTMLPTVLASGSYLVSWMAVANDDGHTTYGKIGFNIGSSFMGLSGTPTLGPQTSNCVGNNCTTDIRRLDALGILAVAWEWLVMAALVFWVGILVTERLILVRAERVLDLLDRARRQAIPLQWLCLSALLIGEIVTLALRSVRVTRALEQGTFNFSALPALLTDTLYGRMWLVRCVLLLLALGLLRWMTHPRPVEEVEQVAQQRALSPTRTGPLRLQQAGSFAATTGSIKAVTESGSLHTTTAPLQRYTGLWFLLAGAIICTYAFTENAASVMQPHTSAVVLGGMLLLAQCVWFGGLAYLSYVLLPLLSIVDLGSNTETIVTFLRRMTPFIVGSIAIHAVSLLFLGETTISASQRLIDDPYGASLLARLILVALIALASVYMLFLLRPRLMRQTILLAVVNAELPGRRTRQSTLERTTRHVKTLVNLQTLLGVGVLLCSALMSFYAPPIVFPALSATSQAAGVAATPSSNTTQQQKVGVFTIALQVQPGRVNSANTVIVSITDANGKSVTDTKVQLIGSMQAMDMGTALQEATMQGTTYGATFAQGAAFSMSGIWNLTVSFQVTGQAAQKVTFQVTVS